MHTHSPHSALAVPTHAWTVTAAHVQTVTDACSDHYKCLLGPLEVLMFRHYKVHAQTVTGAHYRGSCSDRYRCCNRMSRQKLIRLPVSIGSQWRKCKLKREQCQRETQSNKKSDQFKRHYQMHAHDKWYLDDGVSLFIGSMRQVHETMLLSLTYSLSCGTVLQWYVFPQGMCASDVHIWLVICVPLTRSRGFPFWKHSDICFHLTAHTTSTVAEG